MPIASSTTAQTPNASAVQKRTAPPVPASEPPLRKRSPPNAAIPIGQTRTERERERRARERDDVARAPVAPLAAERLRRAVDERAAEPEHERAVDPAADERPHGDDEAVAERVVEQRARGRRRENAGDPGEPVQREDRLLPRVSRLVGVVA